ncbi:MAG: DsbA family protein [Gemmatimonadales bacterium]
MSPDVHRLFVFDRNDHVRGPDAAPVTVVVYGDFECPHTRAVELAMPHLRRRYGEQIRYVYRHFPMNEIHPHAQLAAEASEAVSALAGADAYWAMHDALFADQLHLDEASLRKRSDAIGVDPAAFATALAERRFTARVERDVRSARANGVGGTPAVFINGDRYRGPRNVPELVKAIAGAGPAEPG